MTFGQQMSELHHPYEYKNIDAPVWLVPVLCKLWIFKQKLKHTKPYGFLI